MTVVKTASRAHNEIILLMVVIAYNILSLKPPDWLSQLIQLLPNSQLINLTLNNLKE